MKPVCIWLIGESGIGKTEMVYPLCIDILRRMGYKDPKIFHHQVYARQVEIEFWDGYKQQKIIIYDDAFQMVDDKAKPNPEIFEVIRSCNTFPQHLHMAALHDKNTFSSAEVLIFTTNNPQVKIDSLTFPRAFETRMFDNAYEVNIKDDFVKMNGKVRQLNTDILDPCVTNLDIYEFQRIQPSSSHDGNFIRHGEPIDYHYFSTLMADKWEQKKNAARGKLDWLETYAARPMFTHMNSDVDESFYDSYSYDFESEIKFYESEGKSLEEYEFNLVMDNHKWEQYQLYKKPISKWTEFKLRMQLTYGDFVSKLNSMNAEIVDILSSYPILSALGTIGLALSFLGIYKMFTSELSQDDDDMVIEASGDSKTSKLPVMKVESSGDFKTAKIQHMRVESSGDFKTAKVSRLSVESSVLKTQGCSDEAAFNLITTVLRKNTYKLSYKRGGEVVNLGNITFLKGWIAIMPYHYLIGFLARDFDNDSIIYLSQPGLPEIIQFPLSHIITLSSNSFTLTSNAKQLTFDDGRTQDAVVFSLFKTMCHMHRDITPHIIRQSDLARLRGEFMGSFPTFIMEGKDIARYYKDVYNIVASDSETEIFYPPQENAMGFKSHKQREMYLYNCHSHEGDCGSLVGVYNTAVERKIIGLHIAGGKHDCGGAAPITFERVQRAINSFNLVCHFYFEIPDLVDESKEPNVPSGIFVPLGKCKERTGQAVKTSLRQSSLYGKLSLPITAPALLRPKVINGVLHDPLLSGLKKCGVNPTLIPQDILDSAANDVARVVSMDRTVKRSKYAVVLSYEQAVMGADDEFMTPINRTTSPGFPYVTRKGGKAGKTRWLGSDENYDFTSSDALALQKDVQQLIYDCSIGRVSGVFCSDTLKDERRELAKVDVGKTRVFSACPVHFVLAFRRYFLGFAAFTMHNRIDNEVAVGTNVYSIDWHRIALRMKVKGKSVIAGDFSNFDGCLNSQVLWAILDIINEWYDDGEENARIRMGLWAHIVHSVHIFEDNVYMWTHSQPSGNPFTVIINSIYNSIIMRISWILVMEQHNKSGMIDFNKYVSFVSYGDDNLLNISREVLECFNQQTIADALASINHTYTDELKTGEMVLSRTLDDVLFLKRSFRYSSKLQRYVAPLKREVIYEMLNWTRNVPDPNEIVRMNIQTAAREMSLHGQAEFDSLLLLLKENKKWVSHFPVLETYNQYLTDIRKRPEDFYF